MAEIKTVTALGSAWKAVLCEKCGHRYEYQMTRVGAASMTDLFDPSGSGRAGLGDAAKYELGYKLRNESELMPCPACGAYQSDMIQPIDINPKWVAGGVALAVLILMALIDIALTKVTFPVLPFILIAGGAGAASYKPIEGFLARRYETAYQKTYARLNADLEWNKRRAEAHRQKGVLRDAAAEGGQ